MGVQLHGSFTFDIVVTLNVLKYSANSTNFSNATLKYVIILLVALRLNIRATFRSKI